MVRFFVPGIPAPKGSKNSYRRGGKTIMYEVSPRVKAWQTAVQWVANQHKQNFYPKETPLCVEIEFYMPLPKTRPKAAGQPHIAPPDLDKLLRSTNDGMTGIIFHDDKQIMRTIATKRYAYNSDGSGALITITPYQENNSEEQ